MFAFFGSIPLALVNVLFATLALTMGFLAGWWAFSGRRQESSDVEIGRGRGTPSSDRAIMAIGQVQDVATRVAQDVDSHSTEVGRMSAELALLQGGGEGASGDSAVGIIAKVLRANGKLQAQLAVAEEKLEAQAAEIASHQTAARTDMLTGLPNRRALDQEIARRFAEWQRKGTPFSLVVFDVDRFKTFNDTYGHQAGDEVLRQIGRSFGDVTREMDLPCRFGGEEFVVVMPATTLDFAARGAERARIAIEKLRLRWQNQALAITASYGVAQVVPGDDAAGVLRRADDALYKAKHSGRNRGYLHDGSDCRPVTPDVQPAASPRPASPPPEVRLLYTLPDRQQLDQELKRRVSEGHRYGLPLSLMDIQVMDFAKIAAEHGQRTLDLVLDVVAHRLQDTIREMDLLAREDEDHFAVVLPGSTMAEARQVARRIETTLAHQSITIGEAVVKVDLVVGLASLQGTDDAASLRLRAEMDLANKRSGADERVEPLVT